MRIGLMTGGGDCAGLNAAIRTVVQLAHHQYGWDVVGIKNGYEGLIHGEREPIGLSDVRGIFRLGGTILGASNRTDPFHFVESATGEVVDASDQAFANVKSLGLDAIVVIGGDGTLSLSHRFSQKFGFPMIGIPKTIDNDVHGTDYAIGFDTAVSVVSEAVDRLHTTAESHHRVMLIEVMGRTTGWISLYAGIAGGADIILIPERPYSIPAVLESIERRKRLGRHFTIATVAEGILSPRGDRVYRAPNGVQHSSKLGGICNELQAELAEQTDQEIRTIVLGHLQRGGGPTAFDRILATQLATHAMQCLSTQTFGVVTGWSSDGLLHAPMDEVARGPRLVPADHPLIDAALGLGIYIG